MSSPSSPDLKVAQELKTAALQSIGQGHPVQAAVIIFQTVDALLRLAVKASARKNGASAATIKRASEDEQSFARLVFYLDLLHPTNGLGDRLRGLNTTRNSIIHRLFIDFESVDTLRTTLDSFCTEAVQLNEDLRRLMGITDD